MGVFWWTIRSYDIYQEQIKQGDRCDVKALSESHLSCKGVSGRVFSGEFVKDEKTWVKHKNIVRQTMEILYV